MVNGIPAFIIFRIKQMVIMWCWQLAVRDRFD